MSSNDKKDMVNNPTHYTMGKFETIDVIQDVTRHLVGYESWLIGNILKYVMRYKFKNGIEDLKKAQFYLNRLILDMEGDATDAERDRSQ